MQPLCQVALWACPAYSMCQSSLLTGLRLPLAETSLSDPAETQAPGEAQRARFPLIIDSPASWVASV